MKLFHKFFIALLLIALVPLIIYSVVLVSNTGSTLKRVIDRNNVNTLSIIVRDVNKFFSEVEEELNIARYIERNQSIPQAEKSRLIITRLSNSKLLSGIYLLDDGMKIVTGLSKIEDGSQGLNRQLLQRSAQTGDVELGGICRAEDGTPYFDIVYPAGSKTREYLYFRVALDGMAKRMSAYLKQEGESRAKEAVILDDTGGRLSSLSGAGNGSPEVFRQLSGREKENVFMENGNVRIVSRSGGPGWVVMFSEPRSSAYAPVSRLWIGSIILIIFSAGLALLGAFVLAGNLTKPVKNLISGIEIVASGNLDYRVPELSGDELSKLAALFNSMTIKLKGLQEDIKKTERLSTIGQMANILGHEIRNPLSAIRNSAYLMKIESQKATGSMDPKLAKRIDVIESEIKSMDKIINDMLDFSRTRQPVLSKQDINAVLKGIIEEDPLPSNINLVFELGDVSYANIDSEEMKQVVRNLVNNAVHSMKDSPHGTLTVITGKCTVQSDGKNRSGIFFEIKDTGCGIRRDEIHKIFEPFFSTKSHGTGLGLAVVKRVIEERHHGTISVRSEEGKGTSFFVKIPSAE